MMENQMLSMEQMTDMLDNAPVAVFVASVETKELYYANRLAKRQLPPQIDGVLHCYQIAGFREPCPFCRIAQMDQPELFVRELPHTVNGRSYQISGKRIDWNGKPAHIEYIMDITECKKEEEMERKLHEKLQTTVSNIPCGLSVYQLVGEDFSPLFHNPAFYEIMGYSDEHIRIVAEKTDYLGVHPEDLDELQRKVGHIILEDGSVQHTFRIWNDRKAAYQWVRLDGVAKPQPDGTKLVYGVYSDVGKEKQLEAELTSTSAWMDNIVNAIPGGIVIYRVEGDRFIPTFASDGVMQISGHTRAEYREMIRTDTFEAVYEADRKRVYEAAQVALTTGEVLDVSYRMRHKDGSLIWVHLNGRRVGPLADVSEFYVVFTGMSEESRMYQNIANETVDGVYVIDRSNYELLYANEAKGLFTQGRKCIGQKCFAALHGLTAPCKFCTLKNHLPDGEEHEMVVEGTDRVYATRFRETDWNGVPAYVKYIRDVTNEVNTRREKERLELYFQTIVKNLAGGIAVIHHRKDGSMVPEFLSDGFSDMTGMTPQEAWRLYNENALTGVHPDDQEPMRHRMNEYIASGETHCDAVYRLQKRNEGYIWVKASFTIMQSAEGESYVYAFYHDITTEREQQERLRRQYNELILQHYNEIKGADTLVIGHCNITRNRILEIRDFTDSHLLDTFGYVREEFFAGISTLVVDERDRQVFLEHFLSEPLKKAFERGEKEQTLQCFVKVPKETRGRYAFIHVSIVKTPDTGDLTGILTVTDVTEQSISDRILHQLSVTSYDYVVDLDIGQDTYRVLAYNKNASYVPPSPGTLSGRVVAMSKSAILPKDRELYRTVLQPDRILHRLGEEGSYTISYSLIDEQGEVRTKNMTISPVDLRLGRVCLVCTDITESVRVLEDALNRAEKANRAKSDFLSAMSHDIRTPMNAIMGMTEIASAYLGDRDRMEDCLHKISVSGRHLLSLINDILDMSRIENSQMVMNRRDISLLDLMSQIVTIIEPQAKAAGLHFTAEQQAIRHVYFYGDSLRVNQILINLLSNAVKFTPQGAVRLLVEEITPLQTASHVRYRFIVSDTGVGISAAFQERLFDPFVRNDATVRIEGTGLGLSITKGLVDQMGGTIAVESRLGTGSTFTVELEFEPAKDEAAARTEEAWEASIASSKERAFLDRRFLVAEDNDLNAEILCELLQLQGATLVVKADGRQTVEAFQASSPGEYDAVLMDVQMPEMDGHQATRAIRALDHPDAQSIPIIAMTANAFAEDVQKALDAGMTAHVAKPIDIDVLRVTLEKALITNSEEGIL